MHSSCAVVFVERGVGGQSGARVRSNSEAGYRTGNNYMQDR